MDYLNYFLGIGYGNTAALPWLFGFLAAIAYGIVLSNLDLRKANEQTAGSNSEKQDSYLVWLVLIFIILLAAGLRFYALDFGLPHNFHPDEVPKVNAIMRMRQQGTLNPQYFLHPSLLLYSTYFTNWIFHLLGAQGEFEVTTFFAGRVVSAVCGILSVLLTFFIGRELFSSRIGLLGSAFLAVFPLHVTCSRYLKEDSLLTFVTLLCVYLVLYAVRKGDKNILYLAGLVAGLSASAKYSGALSFCILAAAPFLRSRILGGNTFTFDKSFVLPTIIAIGFMPIGFLIGTPYSIISIDKFLKDFGYESRHMSKGHTSSISAWSQYWMYYFSRSIVPGATLLCALAGVAGIGKLLRRFEINGLYLIALFLLFYVPAEWVKAKPAPQPERYILPCMPFLAIFIAVFADSFRNFLKTKYLYFFVAGFLLLSALTRTLLLASEIRSDTREQMTAWIEFNIPVGAKFLIDLKAYSAKLPEDKYEVKYIGGAKILEDLDVKSLRKSGYDYLLISSLFYDRYFSQPEVEVVPRERVRSVFKSFAKVQVTESKYGTYGFHNPKLTLLKLK